MQAGCYCATVSIFKLRWEEGKNSDLAVKTNKQTKQNREGKRGDTGEKNMKRLMEELC